MVRGGEGWGEQGRDGMGRAGQGWAGQGWAGQGWVGVGSSIAQARTWKTKESVLSSTPPNKGSCTTRL